MNNKQYISKIYAKAAFSYAKKNCCIVQWEKMLYISSFVIKEKNFKNYLLNHLSKKEITNKFLSVLKDFIDVNFINFIKILNKNNRFFLLPKILHEFIVYHNKSNNVLNSTIITTKNINKNDIQLIKKFLKHRFSKKIILTHIIEPNIIDGVILKTNDKVIDGSIKNQLQNIRSFLRE